MDERGAPVCPAPLPAGRHILLGHGGGGRLTRDLIAQVFLPALTNPTLAELHDGAILDVAGGRLAFTTDGFVVHPHVFPGGDIGTLAVNGTVNDLAMCGARPLALSLGVILEEGFAVADLERIVASIQRAARAADVHVVTGDTKVVERGKADGIYLHTSGIGVVRVLPPFGPRAVRPGDPVIVSGPIGEHGIAVMAVREGLAFASEIRSDCAPVAGAVMALLDAGVELHCLRDPTRGGVASALNEIASAARVEIDLVEDAIPVSDGVAGACEVLGLDPLYVACEGRFLAFVAAADAERAVALLRTRADGAGAVRIGTVCEREGTDGLVVMRTSIGGARVVDLLSGDQLPRIC